MRALRALVASLIGVAVVLGSTVMTATTASAQDPESWVSITFTSMTPALPARTGKDSKITLNGTVTNTGKVTLSNLQAVFWRSFDPIQDSAGMQAALASAADEPLGARVVDAYQNIPSETNRTLAPKQSAAFSLRVKVSDLQLPPIDAIYLLGVHVRGRLAPDGPDITLGRGRVFAPIVSTAPENPSQLSTLVVLESRPSLVRKGVFVDDHLATEVGDDGRLTALLDAAEVSQTTFAVDPALIEELQTMRSGYQVLQPDGSTKAGTGQAAAGRWLAEYSRMAADQTGYRLLYGHPDVAALVHSGMTSVLAGGEKASKAVSTTSSLPLLAVPTSGQVDQATVNALAALKPAAIVVDDSSTQSSLPLLEGPDGIPLLNTATTTFGGGPGPDPQDTAVQIRQRALAETWLEASSAGPDDTTGQIRLIRTKAQARSSSAGVTAPWLRREPISRLLDSTPAQWAQRYRYPDGAAERELGQDQLAGVRRLIGSYQDVAELLVRPGDIEASAQAAAARATSASWRGEQAAWQQFVDPQQDALDDILHHAVQIITTPKVVTSAHNVQFPVTIRNTLPASADDPLANAIQVRLEFTSANGQRLTVTPAAEMNNVQIPANAGVTSNAQVHAATNGTVRVTARVFTLTGTPVGEPFQIDVQATQAGTIGWLIAIAAGIVLIGGSALRIRQVAKERAGAAEVGTADSADADAADADTADADTGAREPHPAQVVPPAAQTDRGDSPNNSESLDV